MRRRLRLIWCALSLATGLLCGCQAGGSSSEQPPKDQKPTTIVVYSVLPSGLEEPKERRSFVLRYGLTLRDFDRFHLLDGVNHLVPLRHFSQEVQHQQKTCDARVVATTENYVKVHRFEMAAGRFLKDNVAQPDKGDDERLGNVIVLGAGVAEELFPSEDLTTVVGKTVVLNKQGYEVVGVIKPRPTQKTAGQVEDFAKDVYIPIATARARFGEKINIRQGEKRIAEQVELHQIIITVADPERLQPLAEVIRELLKQHHEKQDWEVTVR